MNIRGWATVAVVTILSAGCGIGTPPGPSASPLDPKPAGAELTKIREQIGSTLFSDTSGFNKKADSGSSDTDNQEIWTCEGPDGWGAKYTAYFDSGNSADETDYERAIEIVDSHPGWSLGSKDTEPVNGLAEAVLVNEHVGAIVISLTRSDNTLHLDLESHCVAGATEAG